MWGFRSWVHLNPGGLRDQIVIHLKCVLNNIYTSIQLPSINTHDGTNINNLATKIVQDASKHTANVNPIEERSEKFTEHAVGYIVSDCIIQRFVAFGYVYFYMPLYIRWANRLCTYAHKNTWEGHPHTLQRKGAPHEEVCRLTMSR